MTTSTKKIPGYHHPEAAAEILGLTVETVRQYLYRKKLKSTRFGTQLWVSKKEVRRYARERKSAGNPSFSRRQE